VAVSYRNSDGKAFMKRLPKGRFRPSSADRIPKNSKIKKEVRKGD
jgi:hypothetical protein